MSIKHLVICGGGHSVFKTLGALNHLEKHGFWSTDNVKTIYGTSAGAILGAIICLKFDHQIVENYMLNRPWQDAFPIKVTQLLNAYTKKGVLDHDAFDTVFKPLLSAKDLPITITLKGLFDFSNIELHMYSLEINQFKIVDVSYKTHPDLPLTSAIAMTCAIPGIFVPFCDDHGCYIDGGVIANYPLNHCLNDGHEVNEILGIKFNYIDRGKEENHGVNKDSNILDFFMDFFGKLIQEIGTENKQQSIPNELVCDATCMSYNALKTAMISAENRRELFDSGTEASIRFLLLKENAT